MSKFLFLSFVCGLWASQPALAAEIWVTHLTDDLDVTNGTCTLREALTAASFNTARDACPAGNGPDVIYFARTGTVNLIQALPSITETLSLIGPGADLLTIDANGFGRVLTVLLSGTYLISGLTLTGGETLGGGGGIAGFYDAQGPTNLTLTEMVITGNRAGSGGGIYYNATGTLRLAQVTVSDNESVEFGGGILSTAGMLEIQNSTITGNTVQGGNDPRGGGLFVQGSATIVRSTFSNNRAENSGGGISFFGTEASHRLDVRHSTLTENRAAINLNLGDGGGINAASTGALYLKNNIIAGNFDDDPSPNFFPDLFVPVTMPVTTYGFNLIGRNAGALVFPAGNPNADGDYVGSASIPLVPNLLPLADNGGPTNTYAPDPAALINTVIDQGHCSAAPGQTAQAYDQRGHAGNLIIPLRPKDDAGFPNADDGCDIGAVEREGSSVPIQFDLKALLDGPYTNVLMHTDLNTAGLLPLAQPFNTAPWNYAGRETLNAIPGDMVDWVLISLSRGAPMDPGGFTTTVHRAMTLEDNGDLNPPDAGFAVRGFKPGHYYVGIDHRNHLGIVSARPIYFKWHDVPGTYDFRTALSKAYTSGGTAMRDRGGLFTMWGGDGDANSSVTAFDFLNEWLPINGGPPGYNGGDFDMNGSGTAFDFLTIWLPANGQATQVP